MVEWLQFHPVTVRDTGSNPVGTAKGRVEQLVGSADCKSVAKALGVQIPPLPPKPTEMVDNKTYK